MVKEKTTQQIYYQKHKKRLKLLRKEYDRINSEHIKKLRRKRYKQDPEKYKERSRKYQKSHIQEKKEYDLKRKFGITQEEYNKILKDQNSVCFLCLNVETRKHKNTITQRLSIDHDHKTGKIRGLLCNNCNRGIGLLQDNSEILKRAVFYLERSKLLNNMEQK